VIFARSWLGGWAAAWALSGALNGGLLVIAGITLAASCWWTWDGWNRQRRTNESIDRMGEILRREP
jgi:hypothetical protein